eukprot:scaffold153998_cov28-Tisochrysis_lutea.AAC.4
MESRRSQWIRRALCACSKANVRVGEEPKRDICCFDAMELMNCDNDTGNDEAFSWSPIHKDVTCAIVKARMR